VTSSKRSVCCSVPCVCLSVSCFLSFPFLRFSFVSFCSTHVTSSKRFVCVWASCQDSMPTHRMPCINRTHALLRSTKGVCWESSCFLRRCAVVLSDGLFMDRCSTHSRMPALTCPPSLSFPLQSKRQEDARGQVRNGLESCHIGWYLCW
jgi:hypothetical protein